MVHRKNKKQFRESAAGRYTLINDNTAFHVKEAYKAMRTNLMFSATEPGCKVIGVTSAAPGEGKSTTVINLAITFSQTGNRVLLIDADMRRPNIKRILNAKESMGLSDVLARLADMGDVITPSEHNGLDILFSGNVPPNPVELLASEAMDTLIEELKPGYDYIFIDTPPINVVTDATVITRLLDGIIIIAREGVSRKDEVGEAINKLKFVNAKILGLVLNDKVYQSKGGRYYSHYGRYGRYKNYYREYGADND